MSNIGRTSSIEINENPTEDKWVKSHCQMCFNACAIEVHVKQGKAVKIKGDPHDPNTRGRLCPRGLSGLAKLYDPDRVKVPLIRTNPEKGRGIDPKWREASWDEALDRVAEKLRKIYHENPNKLLCSFFPLDNFYRSYGWIDAFGTKHGYLSFSGISMQCGHPTHYIGMLSHGAMIEFPDLDYCKYLIILGSEYGFGAYQAFVRVAQELADAREKGLKLVVVDPRLSVGAGRADEWIPIKPATDLAFLLAMIYLLIHEYKLYDAAFLRKNTNAPYLLDSNRHFLTEPGSDKPLVWDPVDGKAKVFDNPDVKDFALEGEYVVNGVKCVPVFQYLKDETRQYTPEWASKITDIPVEKIRRITKEFAEAASIGKTITIEGREYPLRPAAFVSFRGLQGHVNGGIATMAQMVIMTLIGALSVPGGSLAKSLDNRRYGGEPVYLSKGKDGILRHHMKLYDFDAPFSFPPKKLDLGDYFPLNLELGHLVPLVVLNPAQYGFDYEPEALVIYHSNPLLNCGDLNIMERALKKLDMVVNINIYLDETTDYADVVLPDRTYLERFNLVNFTHDMVGLQVCQPVVDPLYDTKDGTNILIELADRGGFLLGENGFNAKLNTVLGLKEPYQLEVNKKYTYEEILDIQAKCHSQGKRDLEWYKRHGNDFRPIKPEQKYLEYRDARLPLYFNVIKYTGDNLKEGMRKHQVEEKLGLKVDWNQYKGIPYWEQSPVCEDDPEFDLYLIAYKSSLTTYADSATNPLIMEIADRDPYHLHIMINRDTAEKKGLQDGENVWLESRLAKVDGRLTLTEGIHPRTVAISQGFGRWLNHPVAKGKGVQYNPHLPIEISYSGILGGSMETAARVKIYRRMNRGKK